MFNSYSLESKYQVQQEFIVKAFFSRNYVGCGFLKYGVWVNAQKQGYFPRKVQLFIKCPEILNNLPISSNNLYKVAVIPYCLDTSTTLIMNIGQDDKIEKYEVINIELYRATFYPKVPK